MVPVKVRSESSIPIEIPPHTLMLRGMAWDSNIYLVRAGRDALIVDTGTGVNWHVYAGIGGKNLYLEGVRRAIIFNTHEHFDHVGGNQVFKLWLESLGIKVLFAAHEVTAKTLEQGDDYVILGYTHGRSVEPQPVNIKLKDEGRLKIGSLELLLLHTPGHTAGSSCLYLDDGETKIMFTGDTVFEGTVGRVDLPTGNRWALGESLQRLLEFEVDFGLPGHGKPIKNWRENLEKVMELV